MINTMTGEIGDRTAVRASIIVCIYRGDEILCQTIERQLHISPTDCVLLVIDQFAQHPTATAAFLKHTSDAGHLRLQS